jgi:hypothetical protein
MCIPQTPPKYRRTLLHNNCFYLHGNAAKTVYCVLRRDVNRGLTLQFSVLEQIYTEVYPHSRGNFFRAQPGAPPPPPENLLHVINYISDRLLSMLLNDNLSEELRNLYSTRNTLGAQIIIIIRLLFIPTT